MWTVAGRANTPRKRGTSTQRSLQLAGSEREKKRTGRFWKDRRSARVS